MTKTVAKVIIFLFLQSTASFAMNVHLSDEKITTTKGMEVDLICSTDSEALGCSFKSPAEHNYNMLRGAAYEEGRIQQKEMNPKGQLISECLFDNVEYFKKPTKKLTFCPRI
mgnify:CR=1 FL=1